MCNVFWCLDFYNLYFWLAYYSSLDIFVLENILLFESLCLIISLIGLLKHKSFKILY